MEYFVHKEPILDSNKRVFAHELTFRKTEPHANSNYPPTRIDENIVRALNIDGVESLVGRKRAFVSVEGQAVRSDILWSLPNNCIFEVPDDEVLDKEVLIGSAVLKKKGYQVVAEKPRLSPFHQIADFIRIDTQGVDAPALYSTLGLLKGLPGKKIAVNVETSEVFQECRELGFDLFQGSFFMDPTMQSRDRITDSQIQLLQLSKDLKANKDVNTIESSFKNSPKLTFGLLQLINSAFFGVSVKVVSIRQAIMLLGYDRIMKWVVLLMYEVSPGAGQANPIVEKAVIRGRVMEALARQANQATVADSAFITGMLSLFPLLFSIRLEELAAEMKLAQEIRDALLTREGFLGTLLNAAEKMDKQGYETMGDELATVNLTTGDLLSAETFAIVDSQSRLFG